MFSRLMYCQISFSVQFEIGKTRMLSPLLILVLYSFHISGLWFFGSHACASLRKEKILSFARDFSSSRRPPPNAAVNSYFLSACFNACVFMMSV